MKDFAVFAEELADCAGEIITESFKSSQIISGKADRTIVTETDLAVENKLREMILQRFPEHGIFGEEYGKVNESAVYQWVIDPIDGTNAFIAKIPTFTTLISLCKDKIPILGVIDQPILRERMSSAKINSPILGNQQPLHLTTSNQQPATTSLNNQQPATKIIATSSTDYFTSEESLAFERVRKIFSATIRHGDAYLYARLALGTIDVVIDAGLKPYDFCAIVPVIQAAGGIITDWQGDSITMNSSGRIIAAANSELHQQAISELKIST